MAIGIGRRQFISALGGAAVAWPLGAHAQQPERIRRVGALIAFAETNSDGQAAAAAFRHGLERLGRVEGQEYSSRPPLYRGRVAFHLPKNIRVTKPTFRRIGNVHYRQRPLN
jgi:hypothetical protein